MALKATVYKADLEVADLDRHYYATHQLTLARHPSETESRLMIRLLAFAMYAAPDLAFGRGISTDDEPDLWRRDGSGEILLWVDLGLPDERRLRRAAARTRHLVLITSGDRAGSVWWQKHQAAAARLRGLEVLALADDAVAGLTSLAARAMKLQCTIQEGAIYLGDEQRTVSIEPRRLHP